MLGLDGVQCLTYGRTMKPAKNCWSPLFFPRWCRHPEGAARDNPFRCLIGDECEPVTGEECTGKPPFRYHSPNECNDRWLPCPFGAGNAEGFIVPRELQRERERASRSGSPYAIWLSELQREPAARGKGAR